LSGPSDRPLRIGVVPVLDGSGGGIYQYSLTMLDGLLAVEPRAELVLFADRRSWAQAEAWRERGYQVASLWPRTVRWRLRTAARRVVAFGPVGRAAAGLRALLNTRGAGAGAQDRARSLPALGGWIAGFGVDFLVFPAPSLMGFQPGVAYVMAVHDLQHRLHPEFPEVSADGEWERRESLFRNGIAGALTVLVDSDIGREDVLDCYGEVTSAERIQVLPFLPASYLDAAAVAAGASSIRERLELPERYLLFPAQFWPHKNHLRVVQALARIRSERGVDVNVVMCGSAADPLRASVLDQVRRTATREGVGDLVQVLGYVEDELMAPLYAASRGVLLPTFFGPTNIPVLEGWAFGVPVLTSDVRGIREQCGDAAILVDPSSVDAIAEGVYSLWSDERLRRRLVSAGRKRLARYGRAEYIARLSLIIQDATRRAREGEPRSIDRVSHGLGAAGERPLPPTVSVVIPAYDRAGTIAAAIESVRNQSFRDLEIIVVDDGSSDGTAEIAGLIAKNEPRLRVVSHPHNRGAQAARNTGILAARGEWIAFLDSDDVYYPESIEMRLDAARRTGLEIIHSACDAVGPDGEKPFPIPPVEGDVYRALLTAPAPMFQGMIVKRELLHWIGLLSEAVPSYQEWDTSIRLAAIAPFGFVDRPTFLYDLRTRGAISRDDRRAADGYEHVVSTHWREVATVAGPLALAEHYRIVAEIRVKAGDRRGAVRCAALSGLAWPLSPRRTLRLARRIAREASGKRPATSSGGEI
jgi:glycosyltransferase involved in cell wall biosynthesis